MLYRGVTCVICISVAVATATNYSGADSSTVSGPDVSVHHLRTENRGPSTVATAAAAVGQGGALGGGRQADHRLPAASSPHHGDRGPSADSAALTATACTTPAPDDDAVALLRSLPEDEKDWRLIEAAKAGALEEMLRLLAAGANIEERNWLGATALHWAAVEGQVEAARCLLARGAAADARTTFLRLTPLHAAALRGHTTVAQLLLASSADPSARSVGGVTPLHCAAASEQPEAASALLERGAEVDAGTSYLQLTPLHVASLLGRASLVRRLLAASADPNATTLGGVTPLHFAVLDGDTEAMTVLIQAGANRLARNDAGWTPLDFARMEGKYNLISILSPPAAGDGGSSPHHGGRSQPPTSATTTTAGCPTSSADDDTVSYLRCLPGEERAWMLIKAAREGSAQRIRDLLLAGADIRTRDWTGGTALHHAADRSNVEAVRCLVENGAEVDATSTGLRLTPLHVASVRGDAAVARVLVASSANPSARAVEGVTPLHFAAATGQADVAAMLLEGGAEVNASTSYLRFTPLHAASLFGCAKVVRLLVANSADPNARTIGGLTPLHFVAVNGQPEAATVLLEAGAERWTRTDDGKTPLDFARQERKQQLINILSASPRAVRQQLETRLPPDLSGGIGSRSPAGCPTASPRDAAVSRLREMSAVE